MRGGRESSAGSGPACPADCKALQGKALGLHRIRVGDCRVVYEVRAKVLIVLVIHIGHRKDIYREDS